MAYEGGKGPKGPRSSGGGFGGKRAPAGGKGGFKKAYGPRKPREGGSGDGGYKKPYTPREGGAGGYRGRDEAAPRSGGYKKPYAAREGGAEGGAKRPYTPRGEGGYKKPYAPREGGSSEGGYKKPYAARAGREGGAEGGYKKPYAPRGEGGYKKPYARREGGDEGGYKRPYTPREGGFERPNHGDGAQARFDGKRVVKHERDAVPYAGDGWLVGYHAVLAALSAGRRKVRKVWLLGEASGELATVLAAHPDWEVETKAKPDFEKEFGDSVHQGVAALVGNLPQPSLPELLATKPKLLVALDQVTDPHNLGAIVRSCAAFGAAGVIVTEHRAAGLSATAAKAAAGAMEVVPVVEVVNLVQAIEMLQEARFTVVGLAGEAEAEIGGVTEKGPLCLVVGSEGDGLRRLTREKCDQLVKIAIAPAVESLNVSVATGVALSVLAKRG
ncbi:MAG: 23S rRNA (guanosine(2251)-2'-O)-methyltransferase RlmB [Proteobacteria bacterium]|nr:23S rRNA (guanosine(2251)-2'-O)-methyltransferase RlmB [Pseudomonadota bacterium]